MPDVVGEQEDYARGLLVGRGLVAEVVEERVADVPEGQVLTVAPGAGSEVGAGEAVVLTIAVSPEYTLEGTFQLIDSGIRDLADGCFGTGGYDDIRSGLGVTVRDGSGSILATGRLGRGTMDGSVKCIFPFEIAALPKVDFYAVEVGRRGELSYSFDELERMGWQVGFSL